MLNLKDPSLLKELAYIDGQWVAADSGATFAVTNPATGEVIARVPQMGEAEAERAVVAAHNAFKQWKRKTAKQRSELLQGWYALMQENLDDLALILTAEQGKPLAEAHGELANGTSFVQWFAEEAKRIYGDTIPQPSGDKRIIVTKEPIGVAAAITPWNFPHAMITRKVAPALAAGCAMVLRPASQTPLSALALAALAERAGIPAGVFSIVTGSATQIGGVLTRHQLVRKFSFTGSTAVGQLLIGQCADTVKKVSMELGGNAPFIVFDDADLEQAVEGAMLSKFRNAGQTCVCANRIYVQDGIYNLFAEKLASAAQKLVLGNGAEAGVTQGPMIDDAAVRKVEEHISDALEQGARLVTGGKRHALGGSFFQPTVLTGVTATMKVAQEETFGPLAPLFRFSTEEEVIAQANATEFGLASYFYTRDIGRVMRVSEELEYGMVGVNTAAIANEMAPFGGVKQSGLGREGSKYGIEDYLEIKYVCLGGIDR
ncbi:MULTISPECIES: 3-sulfolactaldehyde dehydrogenase [unclassified Serratia (in: enterobacteria)]|uniref:3-sulfolactaldehyde dehydrogenase n=1 Tax=unclassified Serratia (in: enterobacteria) TaxID=2647522 RepID=UPI0005013AAA|nr:MULTISPECIES: 3-sulfolactaldehyde dehydrogenase [unclassified Serratia (in: enterobacteria)]KFK96220.1 succinate-semialdehyde dehydrogenase [Serratia sp. Ag2]KFL00637.1 succinate-semialdehyde dehydrogenase [Serratia sp. Ag1]